LQYFAEKGIPVLGIDPADGPAKAAVAKGIPTMCTFFTTDLADQLVREGKTADVMVANNVLAHVPDLNGFVAGIARVLKPDGVVTIEAPYLLDLIDHCEFDTIYHEHLCYYSVTALTALFRRHGLSLNRVERYPIHGGSLRLYVEKREAVEESVRERLAEERERKVDSLEFYQGFAARVEEIKSQLSAILTDVKAQGKSIAGYGAAAKGAVMLNYVGIGKDQLDFVADRNVHKQGRFMPGVHVPIVDPKVILEKMPDYILLLPWNFKDEILRQQQEYRDRGGKFIIPIPSPEVV
jgi:SAM-dependent methyltransferase